jgi:hypothetical protein
MKLKQIRKKNREHRKKERKEKSKTEGKKVRRNAYIYIY